ncbi:pimeloyl-ACP methyl ester carboxylesterase [Saccharothrix tamanrassetensis]|uniref:Pimeloyl-ACP methyl ester carboxylesterase n=1 Tax=Saccharothrix tamanrassetensis TaxID=1051531 RepID=A0A841CTL5_9PSEU|nr:alpha/beta hydrolase [Saccharothrix tamanrassetensis]MBB5960640.1 pimeloyl-ACP methyl ester carboxylesterase [Saccharothrix tamanrassetensis]
MFRTRSRLLVVGAASLTLAGACTTPPPPGAPPPDLTEFHNQQVKFEPCGPFATTPVNEKLFANERLDCARVQVPVDYDNPGGARGEVALLRIPASGEKIGSLLVNPGGPGGSGMNFVATMASKPLWTEGALGQRFDIIGFDPRGVGASWPQLDCFSDADDEARAAGIDNPMDLDSATSEKHAREIMQRCAESAGGEDALTSVSTRETARDMDVLRAAVGDERLTYLGFSYGTELGGVYAETFPENVRALVLDGAVAPGTTRDELHTAQAAASQKGFDRLAEECAQAADCPLGTDPARATERFQALTRPLIDRPAPTTDGRGLGYNDAVLAVLAGMRAEALVPRLVDGLTELAAGRGDTLLALRDQLAGRQPDGTYDGTGDSYLATRCMDLPRRTPAEQTEANRRIREAAPFTDDGRPVQQTHHLCAAWPKPPSRTRPWLADDVAGLPPTLTVSTTGDVATPYQAGVDLAEALGGSLLTVDGAQHGVSLIGENACTNDLVLGYLVDLKTPPEGARCAL